MRNFSCLTVDDTISVHYNDRNYLIDIVDAKPNSKDYSVKVTLDAVCIVECDMNVDFDTPLVGYMCSNVIGYFYNCGFSRIMLNPGDHLLKP